MGRRRKGARTHTHTQGATASRYAFTPARELLAQIEATADERTAMAAAAEFAKQRQQQQEQQQRQQHFQQLQQQQQLQLQRSSSSGGVGGTAGVGGGWAAVSPAPPSAPRASAESNAVVKPPAVSARFPEAVNEETALTAFRALLRTNDPDALQVCGNPIPLFLSSLCRGKATPTSSVFCFFKAWAYLFY